MKRWTNAGAVDVTNWRLGSYHLKFRLRFRFQQVFQLRALSGDEQFSGGRIHARPPDLVNCSTQLADLGSKPQDLQRSRFIHGDPGHP
jgi:hypothetical protein